MQDGTCVTVTTWEPYNTSCVTKPLRNKVQQTNPCKDNSNDFTFRVKPMNEQARPFIYWVGNFGMMKSNF